MSKVYVIIETDNYEDVKVLGVTSTLELAENFLIPYLKDFNLNEIVKCKNQVTYFGDYGNYYCIEQFELKG